MVGALQRLWRDSEDAGDGSLVVVGGAPFPHTTRLPPSAMVVTVSVSSSSGSLCGVCWWGAASPSVAAAPAASHSSLSRVHIVTQEAHLRGGWSERSAGACVGSIAHLSVVQVSRVCGARLSSLLLPVVAGGVINDAYLAPMSLAVGETGASSGLTLRLTHRCLRGPNLASRLGLIGVESLRRGCCCCQEAEEEQEDGELSTNLLLAARPLGLGTWCDMDDEDGEDVQPVGSAGLLSSAGVCVAGGGVSGVCFRGAGGGE